MAGGQLGNLMRFVRRLVPTPVGAERCDRQLLEQFASQRDETAFAELVGRHGPLVFNVCRRVLDDDHAAEDAFQAVFLVLARKAAALHWQESIGNWLYETAYRTACKAKADAVRRHARERAAPVAPRSTAMPQAEWRDLRAVLDQELSRLPAKYRTPLVLCYLEGKSNEEAGRLLGWPLGTVSGRLARGRDLLRDRLSRRGLALASSSLAALLSQKGVEASLPPTLAAAAVQSALTFTSGAVTAGTIPAPIVALTEGVLQTMLFYKLKFAASLVLLLALVGVGLGLLASQFLGQTAVAVPIGEVKPVQATESKPENGLMLSLSADKTETVMKADGSNAEPVKLKLTFNNVSDKAIKLDTHLISARHLKATIKPPDEKSLRVQRVLAGSIPSPPAAAEFRTIEPGKSWSIDTAWTFPGYLPIKDFGGDGYTVLKPGEFRIQFTYENPQVLNHPLAQGSWTGALASNEVVVKVKPAK